MNAGALTLVDHVLPEVPIRQFVLTLPFPLRFPLAFDGKLLGQVLRIFIDTVASNYRKRLADRGIRAVLYMGTLSAIKHNSVIAAFHARLIAAGKLPMVAIVACMHKLLTILNAMLRSNSPWSPEISS